MFKWKKESKSQEVFKAHSLYIDELKEQLKNELLYSDITFRHLKKNGNRIVFCFLESLIDKSSLDEFILAPIQNNEKIEWSVQGFTQVLPLSVLTVTNQLSEIISGLIEGNVYIYVEGDPYGLLTNLSKTVERGVEKPETESNVYGPKISFTESLVSNMNILRNNLKDPNLCMQDLVVGKRVKTKAKLVYIQGIADEELVTTFKQRISELEIDYVPGNTVLGHLIENNSWSVFPQLMTTELPDRISIALYRGKVAVLMDRSPDCLYGPTTFFSYFESTEDVYMRWNMGLFLRVLRLTALFLSVLLTPAYVAVLTYHYEVIPSPMLVTLGESRSKVPFPPVFETLLLEFVIELLREAGARLPTKVGQTIGIVGGIVIGQAAVQAGFTSNILIIMIALSALGSFTTPSYLMGTAIRMIRFPIIIIAGIWGGIGIMVAFCFFIIHLLRLETLGKPYLSPVYPLQWRDLGYSFFLVPYQYLAKRPQTNKPVDKERFSEKKAKLKKDIDE
ncbi:MULTISPECIES: spore germination protein [Neobacillus]|uniref:Spore germination protein n=1 Tax=Neobacillus rhizophilus TaxID=2833579 RepID=A0A942UC35_9BACI|nr:MULTISPECIES: spore germination protein [Neobacillus]MBS4215973.1 spore germination protein [Neobacillus rhizophilus]